ncbi:hypothetical protein JXA32_05035 [Candidatus Sumerlaeota bacterium]|nr:hypothetical protein [Candidatus Sumerlaeota bacterium]
MNINQRLWIPLHLAIYAIVIALTLPLSAQDQEEPEKKANPELGHTQCFLEPLKKKVYLGEPIYLYVTLINRMTLGGKPRTMNANSDLNPSASLNIQFYSQDEPHNVRRFIFEPEQDATLLQKYNIILDYGEYWNYPVTVCASPATISGFIVDKPGRYVFSGGLQIVIDGRMAQFVFPPCEVEILPPPDDEVALYDSLCYPETALALQQPGRAQDAVIEDLRKLLAERPDSLYAPHLHFTVSAYAFLKGDNQDALEQITQALNAGDGSIPRECMLYQRAQINIKLGDIESVVRDLHTIQLINPKSHFVTPEDLFSKKYLMLDAENAIINDMWPLYEP